MLDKMNELDSLFTSKNSEDVLEFYSRFNTVDDLLNYSRNRTYHKPRIFEKDGDKDVVAVIPTRDHNGEFAKSFCDIFKGFHIIMAESGNDPYFNYGRNVNVAIHKAVSYDPKWIIVSNDDMYGIDDPAVLRQGLLRLDNGKIDNVWISPEPEHHHCRNVYLVRKRAALGALRKLQGGYLQKRQKILDRFGVDYFLMYSPSKPYYFPFVKYLKTFLNTEDFFVLSGKYTHSLHSSGKEVYDEIYINANEDNWLSLNLGTERSSYIDFKIGSKIGSSYGLTESAEARRIIGTIFFDQMLKKSRLVKT